ncbi:UDP-N-acetylglucosamine 2-epimerase (non-hydrolyzing) [Neobacillus sp. 3P2-tot-E-2]|uniref:non-hydrolyzing UDP-N-acetylglucosamine 2-epimerase n=1 Tax=Neobacillus sp. 3P2-tot-E-2 TaxID=3132212 RepID=UPI0039A08C71
MDKDKIKVLTIFGTRPEAIKMAPVIHELNRYKDKIESIVAVTAQHREMLDQVLRVFDIKPNYDLNIMTDRQSLSSITTRVLNGIDEIIKIEKPNLVLVHGDTTTTFAASLAAFYNQVLIGHVEAGLRTYNKHSPYPEEINRQLTGNLADLHFAPTLQAENNLLRENKSRESIFVTGNTAIDALKLTVTTSYSHEIFEKIGNDRLILVTAHRRENLGQPMRNIFRAIKRLVNKHKDIQVVFPVHLNPLVQEDAKNILGGHTRIHLTQPLGVIDFQNFAARSYLILTDSGGIQEEAPSLGVPVLVLRDTTERPEGVKAGTLKLAGTNETAIFSMAHELLTDTQVYQKMAQASNPFGDGEASRRIVETILYKFGKRNNPTDLFKCPPVD